MKAITLHQPWASLIAEGVKTIETRPKQHPWRSAIGQTIAIHAAARIPTVEAVGEWELFPRGEAHDSEWFMAHHFTDLRDARNFKVPLGAVVATCTLVDVLPMVESFATVTDDLGHYRSHVTMGYDVDPTLRLWIEPGALDQPGIDIEAQRPFGDFAPGRWALLLDNVRKCAPFPCRGHQGLWTLPADVADNLVGRAA